MTLIGMREAGERLGIHPNSARLALTRAGVAIVVISPRAYAVDDADLEAFAKTREGYSGLGRPRGSGNRPKPTTAATPPSPAGTGADGQEEEGQ